MNWQGQVPPVEVRRQPGLSETLTRPRSPLTCQSCGWMSTRHGYEPGKRYLDRWQECDEFDRKTDVVVLLCNLCADRLIDPHHRLYHRLEPNRQFPATHVPLCMPCRWRDGLTCNSPMRLARGGPGLRLEQGEPASYHACGTRNGRRTGWTGHIWPPVTGCPGFEPTPEEHASETRTG
jgi:hypothetical protein